MKIRLFPMILAAAALVAFGAGCKKASTNTNEDLNTSIVNFDDTENTNLDINGMVENSNENENTNVDLNTNTSDENENTNLNINTSVSTNANTNTSTNTNSSAVTNDNITVTLPAENDELVSPFYVQGTAVSGNSVYVRVRGASGTPIFTETVSVNNHAFKGKLLFDFTSTKAGSVEVFQKDAEGTEINLVSVPVTFTLTSNSNSNANTNS